MNGIRRGNLNPLTRRSFLTTSLMAAPAITHASGTFDSKTEQNWPGFRGPGAQGGAADGKIHCPVEQGTVYVIKAWPTLEKLAKNELIALFGT